MRLIGTAARLGIIGVLGLLLSVVMNPANWGTGSSGELTTLEFATAVLDDWAFTLVILGAFPSSAH